MAELVSLIRENFSGLVALRHIGRIGQFHRIQASPGFRQAARYCLEILTETGVEAKIHSFPATEDAMFWSSPGFQEWDASEAVCYLVAPEEHRTKLADFRENPISLIQRSAPFDGEVPVILVEDGEELEDYRGLDVAGKVVLTRGRVERVRELAVEKFGAVGILYDGMRSVPPLREHTDLPDARQYTSFWWGKGDKKCFGFVLTPRQGDKLRRLLKEGHEVRIKARVDARFYDGALEVVEGVIPGRTDEWVVVIAHLCHPLPSANDNASGSAVALEVAVTLRRLINRGDLPVPLRGIRFLWVPEIYGTYAYLSTHEDLLPRIVAGLNLDMVGQNQELCGSVLLLESPPMAAASFVPFVLYELFEQVGVEARSFSGTGGFPLFRYHFSPFSGGSDHYILSDPTVGIPTPMIIQWPDRFYHTDQDTPDKSDPDMLHRIGTLAAAYAFTIANATPEDARRLGYGMLSRWEAILGEVFRREAQALWEASSPEELSTALAKAQRRLGFWARSAVRSLESLKRLWPGSEGELRLRFTSPIESYTARLRGRLKDVALLRGEALGIRRLEELPAPEEAPEVYRKAAKVVPVRLHRGPVAGLAWRLKSLPEEERERWHRLNKRYREYRYVLPALALYWADGRRTLAEILELVELETGLSAPEYLTEYFEFLEKMGYVRLEEIRV